MKTRYIKYIILILILAAIFIPALHPASAAAKNEFSCNGLTDWTVAGCIMQGVAWIFYFVMFIVARFLWLAGIILDVSLNYTLNMSDFMNKVAVVNIGWTVFRDLSNLFFIFILLFISIQTILGIKSGETKKLLGMIILVAILINFSLFITKAVIDASNLFALHFYNLITNNGTQTLSESFMGGLKIQTLYDSNTFNTQGDTSAALTGVSRLVGGGANLINIILITICGSIFILVTAFVFFAAAWLFFLRLVVLSFVMLLSPLAFIGMVLPGANKYTGEWWHKLISNALFAPLYMALAYIVVRTINSNAFQVNVTGIPAARDTFAQLVTGNTSASLGIVINFIILIMMMVGCLLIAKEFGAKGADTMMKWGDWLKGAGTGFLGKQTLGRMGRALDERMKSTKLFGATTYGDTFRKYTAQALGHAKFGGSESFEEFHARKKKLETRGQALDMKDRLKSMSPEYDAKIDAFKTAETERDAALDELDAAKATGYPTAIKAAEDKLKTKQDALSKITAEREALELKIGQTQQAIAPEVFGHLTEEDYDEGNGFIMRFATNAQVKALLANDEFSQSQKDHWLYLKDKDYFDKTWEFEHGDETWDEYRKTGKLTGKENIGGGGLAEYQLNLKKWQDEYDKAYAPVREADKKAAEANYWAMGGPTAGLTPEQEQQEMEQHMKEYMANSSKQFLADYMKNPAHEKPEEPNFAKENPQLYRKLRAADKEDVELFAMSKDIGHPDRPQSLLLRKGFTSIIRESTLRDVRKSKNIAPQIAENMRYVKNYPLMEALDAVEGIDADLPEAEKQALREKMKEYDFAMKRREELIAKRGWALQEKLEEELMLAMQGKTPGELVGMPSGIRKRMAFVRKIDHVIAQGFGGQDGRDVEDANINIRAALRDEIISKMPRGDKSRLSSDSKSFLEAWRGGKTQWKNYFGDKPILDESGQTLKVYDRNNKEWELNRWTLDWKNVGNPRRNEPGPDGWDTGEITLEPKP